MLRHFFNAVEIRKEFGITISSKVLEQQNKIANKLSYVIESGGYKTTTRMSQLPSIITIFGYMLERVEIYLGVSSQFRCLIADTMHH